MLRTARRFDTEAQAALAYDIAAIRCRGRVRALSVCALRQL